MTLTLTINMDNAAFDDSEGESRAPMRELVRIFRTVADQIEADWYPTPSDLPSVFDVNGNKVGEFTVS